MSIPPEDDVTPEPWSNWFEDSPIPMTLEDWSRVKRIVDRLRGEGVRSISEYVAANPRVLAELGPAGKILDANKAAVEVYGAASKAELLRAFNEPPDLDSYNPTTGLCDVFVTSIERFSQGAARVEVEGPATTLGGEVIYIRTTTSIGRGCEHDWSRVLQTVEDMTERKRAEEELRKRAGLHRQAEIVGRLGHWEWDIEKERLTACSEQYAAIYEMTVDEALACFSSLAADRNMVHPDDLERYLATEGKAYEDFTGIDMEFRVLTRTGAVRHVHRRSEFLFDDRGHAIKEFGTVQDVTDRKLVEERTERSNALYRQAEAMGKLGHWTWDHAAGRMESCSEQFARLYGLSVTEALEYFSTPESEFSAIHPDDRERYERHVDETEEQRRGLDIEYRVITPAGELRHFYIQSELVFDENGQIVRSFGTEQDVTERRRLSEQLAYQASHDPLTGLTNRAEFEQRLDRVLTTAHRRGDEHALCYLDLDQFKVINDTCGHMAGDELLRQIAQLLSRFVRKRDTLARLGGDEFAVLMERCTQSQAQRVANAIRHAVEEFRFAWDRQVFQIGVSIGLVPIDQTSQSPASVMSAADAACYAAKDEGRNRVHVYRVNDSELARRRGEMRWSGRLTRALDEDRFALMAQPIWPLGRDGDGPGVMFEVLVRLTDEAGNLVSPGVFLPAAERYGLAAKLDRWVVQNVLDTLGRATGLLAHCRTCFINLSGVSLVDDDFLTFVDSCLRSSRVPAYKICFEVTETATIANLSRAMQFIATLREQGCHFALDDFGSGLSSFAYLKELPVDFLKIDGGFVRGIAEDETAHAFVRAINDIGRVMGKRTIAESVENDAVLDKLREIGVQYAQGFGTGRPVPLERLVRDWAPHASTGRRLIR